MHPCHTTPPASTKYIHSNADNCELPADLYHDILGGPRRGGPSGRQQSEEQVADSRRHLPRVLGYFDYFFTTVFTLEITLKIFAYGALQKGGYMRAPGV